MERDHFENLGLDWRIISIWILKKRNGDMGWIDLAQDRDRWQALVNVRSLVGSLFSIELVS